MHELRGTHYETLGVAPGTPPDAVRRAYVDLARRLHPDRFVAAGTGERTDADRRMREVNEAFRVLGNPGRRVAYDTELLRARTAGTARTKASGAAPTATGRVTGDLFIDTELVDTRSAIVRSLPWLLLLGALGAIFVFTAYATGGSTAADDLSGSCVRPDARQLATPVSCGADGARLVQAEVLSAGGCPPGTEVFQPADSDRALCFAP
ncbi:MAG: J domain-containing protein [Acidimicrobiia bacterium]|nr:J domain-containing protein [Acidimicrobiia bacterium]